MSLTRDHKGTGAFELKCDGCGRVQRAADGHLPSEVVAKASAKGWRCTHKADTCPGCTRKADTAAKRKAR